MRRVGRPRKNPKDRASQQMGVRFTPKERELLDRVCEEEGFRSAGALIRQAVVELYAKTFPQAPAKPRKPRPPLNSPLKEPYGEDEELVQEAVAPIPQDPWKWRTKLDT